MSTTQTGRDPVGKNKRSHYREDQAQPALTLTVVPPPPKPDKATLVKGARFGRWRLLRDSGVLRSGHRYAPCECVCGQQALVYEVHLLSGRSNGCKSKVCQGANG